ncbi:hypothetical protein E2C01_036097 [Portunus trituberculatus]|uniref:Uncharacterized protein n=1 Tax=Portunus trituberculatus TaxID=210409 RepID=A0A5B7FA67_PORTR|nr:hypothetical protein [Portunus trituberculatus]
MKEEKTGREWMVLLLGLCRETSERMMEAVKEYLERMWQTRSSRSKGLALERSRATCSIKIKIKRSRATFCFKIFKNKLLLIDLRLYLRHDVTE